ncbi:MAG TPA: hypothetical protein VMT27_04210 [Actinomycetes bacterium]|nr:hypothetical protein [Actinomycetes bacterium]
MVLKVLLALIAIGSVIYLVVRLTQRGTDGGSVRPRRPVPPDDDPGFLRDLDDQLWRKRRGKPGKPDGDEP